jgi:hypothetical protein
MEKLLAHKNLLVSVVVVILLVIFGYWYFNGSSSASAPILSASDVAGSDALLATLNQLKSLSLDDSIFSRPAFEALTDETVTISPVTAGRPNPFAPLPGVVSSVGAAPANTSTNVPATTPLSASAGTAPAPTH